MAFVTWDDWGGFYDHAKPYVVRYQTGPGFRVPLIVVSPCAKPNYVAKTDTEFGTLLAFIEETFDLDNLGGVDVSEAINNFDDFFDWSHLQKFRPVRTDEPPSFFENVDEGAALRTAPGNSSFWKGTG
ncbi:MAG TPA: alkaline phosphatase family protein [Candidatus Cybelea sp.]